MLVETFLFEVTKPKAAPMPTLLATPIVPAKDTTDEPSCADTVRLLTFQALLEDPAVTFGSAFTVVAPFSSVTAMEPPRAKLPEPAPPTPTVTKVCCERAWTIALPAEEIAPS